MSSPVDRRLEFAHVPWQQGFLIHTRTVMRMPLEWRSQAAHDERLRVFADFTTRDEGRSRVLIFVCEHPQDAQAMVKWHNIELEAKTPAL